MFTYTLCAEMCYDFLSSLDKLFWNNKRNMDFFRRKFIGALGMLAAGSMITAPAGAFGLSNRKLRVVLVGAGVRGTSFWGKRRSEERRVGKDRSRGKKAEH